MKKQSHLEQGLETLLKDAGFHRPEKQYRFHPTRKWRFDFAWPDLKIAIECEGGIFVNGGHNRGKIYSSNCEKYNQAVILGWRLLRYPPNLFCMIEEDLGKLMPTKTRKLKNGLD